MAAGRTPALPSSAFAGAVAGALADATTVTSGSPSTIAPSIAAAATTATATTLGQRGSDRESTHCDADYERAEQCHVVPPPSGDTRIRRNAISWFVDASSAGVGSIRSIARATSW